MQRIRLQVPACVLALVLAPTAVLAAGTPAGTSINNTATVSFSQDGSPKTAVSNTDTVRVAEILDVVMTLASPSVSAAAGATQAELTYTVTNTGNGSEAFRLVPLSAGIPGDIFDPVLSTPAVYFDSDNSGDFSAGDVAYVPGANDPILAADGAVRIFVLNDIPGAAADGARGRSQLTASAVTGTGAAGTAFPGQGDGGVDAVAGLTEADSVETGEYVVESVSMSVVKSQTVADPFGGTQPVPGARINYRIVVTVAGGSTATAALLDDPVPANTTYVPGTITLNGAGLSDAADADSGTFQSSSGPHVQVRLGDLTQAAGPQTIEFSVTIN